jgi:hypothetical protein
LMGRWVGGPVHIGFVAQDTVASFVSSPNPNKVVSCSFARRRHGLLSCKTPFQERFG